MEWLGGGVGGGRGEWDSVVDRVGSWEGGWGGRVRKGRWVCGGGLGGMREM